MAAVNFPFPLVEREYFLVRHPLALGSFLQYIRTWSAYQVYKSAVGEGLSASQSDWLDEFCAAAKEAGLVDGDLAKEIEVTIPYFLIKCSKGGESE